ncbi:MAG: YlbF family regulator [Lachnospiraceae bacterium]|nr:YlbF family regulator [Lachnospiraceae bacterium]
MKDYKDSLAVFIEEIKKSSVYTDYIVQRDNLRKYPELKKQVDEYRKKNYELQNNTWPDQLFDEMDRFQKEYESFRENPVVHDFLAAELALCRMMQMINYEIVKAVSNDFE